MTGGSVLVAVAGRWVCDKHLPALVVGGVRFCPTCGRRIRERFRVRPGRTSPEYLRSHTAMWGMWGGC